VSQDACVGRMATLLLASLVTVRPLDPLTLLQDKGAQTTRLRPTNGKAHLETATLALG